MLVVTDSMSIKGDLSEVYRCFWNPELWPLITPHVKHIEMIEENETRQRFKMRVEANGKEHSMETVREGIANESITYRQTHPPPIFFEHRGEWRFTTVDEGVQVTLTHRVRLNEVKAREILRVDSLSEAESIVRETLKRNGSLTMTAIKRLVEEGAAAVSKIG